jgi:hypothetical protein
MDSKGKLVPDKLKEAFARYQSPADTKVTDLDMFVDACIAKDGELGSRCYLHALLAFYLVNHFH